MFLNDLRYALRRLGRSPGYVATAVLALTLGIGGAVNIFSFVKIYLLRPLPQVKELDRVALFESRIRTSITGSSYPDFVDFARESRAFEKVAASMVTDPILTGRGEPERVLGAQVSPGYFDLFTVQPPVGRAFSPSDDDLVVLISDRFWQRRFGGSPDAIGQTLVLDNAACRIIGVMPPRFRSEWNDFDLWRPLSAEMARSTRGRRSLNVFGRLKPGTTFAAAQRDINTITSRLAAQYPETNANLNVTVRDYVDRLGSGPRQSIDILVYVVAFVLLIACSNVANLQLARATGRATEIAIRISMGASRWRIIRQVVIESTVVALAGGLFGFGLSLAGAKFLLSTLPPQYRPLNDSLIDSYVLAFTIAVAVLTGVVSGIAPAFQVSRVGVSEVLKEGGRGNSGGSRGKLRSTLVCVEVTLALILLLGSSLLIQSFIRMQSINPGYRAQGLLVGNVDLPQEKYPTPEQRANLFRNLVERASAIPGVRSAAVTTNIPLYGGGGGGNFIVEGQAIPAGGSEFFARSRSVTPGYLQTMGIGLRRGRYLTDQDTANNLRVAIVNERFAEQFFPKADPIGKRFKWGRDLKSTAPWLTIVGVAADVKPWSLTVPPVPEIYAPFAQEPRAWGWIVIRSEGSDAAAVAPALRAELRALDRDQPLTAVQTMERIVAESMTIPRLMTVLMAIFAGIAMVMAALGIYGVVSYSVAQRTHEFGIRMALGAGSPSVVKLVLRQALWMVGIGLAIGVPAGLAATQVLRAFLYGVGARDPLTFVLIPLAVGAVGVAASYIPARRATRVDPVVALRCE